MVKRMSSVLVKGMEIPECCGTCIMRDGLFCMASDYKRIDYKRISYGSMHRREEWCPLVALPDKHGRLVDLDALKKDLRMGKECDKDCPTDWKACHYDRVYAKQDFCIWLDDAQTIVEAEDNS